MDGCRVNGRSGLSEEGRQAGREWEGRNGEEKVRMGG